MKKIENCYLRYTSMDIFNISKFGFKDTFRSNLKLVENMEKCPHVIEFFTKAYTKCGLIEFKFL